ncbi:MAG: ATP-dependent protease ATPase subunit HslU [Thermoguttaceae bacterium]
MRELTPREIVTELDKHIVGQDAAKRAVAVAIRNRWRRQRVDESMQKEIAPKNIMMMGPTGVGKTEIARRLATLTGAPFIKVEATKYTEVGYYGRDVESMIRELVENSIGLVREREREKVKEEARQRVDEKLLDLLLPSNFSATAAAKPRVKISLEFDKESLDKKTKEALEMLKEDMDFADSGDSRDSADTADAESNASESAASGSETSKENSSENIFENSSDDENEETPEEIRRRERYLRNREKMRAMLLSGALEDRKVTVTTETRATPIMMGMPGMDAMDLNLDEMFEKILPKHHSRREMTVKEAREFLLDQESDSLINREKVQSDAVELAENVGIIFIDEIDKIVASEKQHGADVSRQGVQRDLLPIVEGTTIQTKYGYVKTDHILFIAAGAFHRSKPSDLMPELQGRFPVQVELSDLSREDFVRILTEPSGSLTKQYKALMQTEGIDIEFEHGAIIELANYAYESNQTTQNIGARRLYTILERLLEVLSFDAPDTDEKRIVIDAGYVKMRLNDIAPDEDLKKFIL